MNKQNCTLIANAVAKKDITGAIAAIDTILLTETGAHWIRDLNKLKAFLSMTVLLMRQEKGITKQQAKTP